MNPQFHIQIPRSGAAKCHVVVSVTQQYETNVAAAKKRRTLHHIGFAVYEVPPAMTRLTPQYVLEHVSLHREVLNLENCFLQQFDYDRAKYLWDIHPPSSDHDTVS